MTTFCRALVLASFGLSSHSFAQQTIGGISEIPSIDTYLLQLNFTGNVSEGYVFTQTNNETVQNLLNQAQKATFVSYDDEFTRMIGENPKAELVVSEMAAFLSPHQGMSIVATRLS